MENLNDSEDVNSARENMNPLNAELNPICYLLALLGAHHMLHVSRIRVKDNMKTSAKKSIRQHELKQHKPWFDEKLRFFF